MQPNFESKASWDGSKIVYSNNGNSKSAPDPNSTETNDVSSPITFGNVEHEKSADEANPSQKDGAIEPTSEVSTASAAEKTNLNGPEAKRVPLLSRNPSEVKQSKSNSKKTLHGTIVWKRKHVPPSIPGGKYAFGYQENKDGELVPRKPPTNTIEEQPGYLTSFVEKAKHESKGYRFAKGHGRLSFKVNEGPGPNRYDPLEGDKFLNGRSNSSGPAVMTLAPCKRITDEIVADSIKKVISKSCKKEKDW